MPILYSVVSRGTTVLAEHTAKQGNASSVVKRILETVPVDINDKKTYTYESYLFHYIVNDGLIVLCLSDEAFGRQIPFVFLDDVLQRFLSEFGTRWKTASSYSLQTDFGRVLRQLGDYYSNDTNSERITRVQGAISEVRGIMSENLEKAFARGARIEDTLKTTEGLAQNSLQFKTTSISLKNTMWCKNVKLWIILGVVIVILAYIIAAAVCKSPIFKGCWDKKKKPANPSNSAFSAASPSSFFAVFVVTIALAFIGM